MIIRCKTHGEVQAIHLQAEGTFGCPKCIPVPPVVEVTDPELIAKIKGTPVPNPLGPQGDQ
jgi:hypothetical protein